MRAARLDAPSSRDRPRRPGTVGTEMQLGTGWFDAVRSTIGRRRLSAQRREAILRRAFHGDRRLYEEVLATLREATGDAKIVLRGSAVTGESYRGHDPFDAEGPGTSDLDLVLVGPGAFRAWTPRAFYLPRVSTKPLTASSPWIAPALEPARRKAQELVGRPVSIQAMAGWFLDLRAIVQGQRYVTLTDDGPSAVIEAEEKPSRSLRLVSYNIRFGGRGRDGLLAEVLGRLEPDLVVLQEATDPRVLESIARRLAMPEIVVQPLHSVAAISRARIERVEWHSYRHGRDALELGLADGLQVLGLHLTAGMSWRGERVRIVEAGRILEGIEGAAPRGLGIRTPGPELAGVAAAGGPEFDHPVETGPQTAPATKDTGEPARPPRQTVIVGDFNSVAPGDAPVVRRMPWWIRVLLRFDGGIHSRVIQMFLDAGFVDGFRRLHPEGLGFTMPAVNASVRLDYAMLSPDLVPHLRSCEPVEPDGLTSPILRASDHLPLLSVLGPA
jgi:exodeoxyribonuclease III